MKNIKLTIKQVAHLLREVTGLPILNGDVEDVLAQALRQAATGNSPQWLKSSLPLLREGATFSPWAVRLAHACLVPERFSKLMADRVEGALLPIVVSHYKKGGTGKTTVLVNTAIALAMQGVRVLVIDADPQGTATTLFDVNTEDPSLRTLQHVMFGHASNGGHPVALEDAIVPLYANAKLDLVPSDIELSSFDRVAYSRTNRERLFQRLLQQRADFFASYDVVLIDTNPGTNLLNFNLMFPASHVLMPVSLDVPSLKSMRLMHSEAAEMDEAGGSEKTMLIVGNAFHPSMVHSRESLKALRQHYGPSMAETVIPAYAGVSRQGWSEAAGRTLIEREPSAAAAKRLATLAIELMERTVWQPSGLGRAKFEPSEGMASAEDRLEEVAA